ncbi:TAXI family TRAP transporter solute-binding subunit, partial [Dehalococcoidia bacterium]|nr:TAXI family TRAP transporter solute-binding subunit [Dehalococcoidia bacterium]
LDIEAAMDIKIIPVSRELIERANEVQPGLHRWATIPGGHFRGVEADQGSYFYVVGDFILKEVPEDIVYKMVKAVYEERAAIAEPLASLRLGKFDSMFENLIAYDMVVPLHAGAVRFFQERGYDVPDHLIPPEAGR